MSEQPVIDQQDTPFLNSLVIAFSTVGLVGLIPLSWMLIKYRKDLRNPAGRIVIGLAACNGIDGIFKLIGRAGINSGIDSALCLIQGFVLQQLLLTQWLLGAVIAYYTASMVLWKRSINSFKKREGWILGSCFVIPLPISFYAVFSYPNGKDRLIGNADLWCWVSTEYYPNFQMYIGYIPIMAIALVEIITFFAIVIKVTRDGPRKVLSTQLPYKRYLLQRYFAYMLFFFIGWTCSILNRLVTVSTKSSVVTLLAAQAVTNSMLGMLHFIAFWYSWQFHPLYCSDRNSDPRDQLATGPGLDFEPGLESDDETSEESFETAQDTISSSPAVKKIENITGENCSDLNEQSASGGDGDTNTNLNKDISMTESNDDESMESDSVYFDAKDRVSARELGRDQSFNSRSQRIFIVPK